MNAESPGRHGAQDAEETSRGLAALSGLSFDQLDATSIFAAMRATVETLAPCRVEGSYRFDDGELIRCPPSQPARPELEDLARRSGWDGEIHVHDRGWAHAFALRSEDQINGCLVITGDAAPKHIQLLLLTLLVQHTAGALACALLHRHNIERTEHLEDANTRLASAVDDLRARSTVQEVIAAALAAGSGEQSIADALHELTSLPVALEDRFGNLRCWSGPDRPQRYPKTDPDRRERLLHQLGACSGATRIRDRIAILVKPRAEVLGVLALVDPRQHARSEQIFALECASSALGPELSHQLHLAEMELSVRRDLVDDLIAGTDEEGAYARAAALGRDLRRPHYVVVLQSEGRADNTLVMAARRAATTLRLHYLQGRHAGLVVLLTDGRPDPRALHRAVSRNLGRSPSVIGIGIGPRCDTPTHFPMSFAKAQRALNIRLHSAAPDGASAYDELGFYRLVDAAHRAGAVEDFVWEWLGVLIDYDRNKNSNLVDTLGDYLECGGSYDESAAVLHIHRSTLRYRLARISELTGHDLRDVDTKFNLQAAARAWRFLAPIGQPAP